MKKPLFLFIFLGIVSVAFGQVPEEIRQQFITIYTQYAESKTANDRLQFIRNPESYRDLFSSYYGNRNIRYTPIRFGNAIVISPTIYVLEEFVDATRGSGHVEVLQYRYFVKTDEDYKIDWEASVAYNPTTWTRFKALESEQAVAMRCYAQFETSIHDDYFGIDLLDNAVNYQVRAYVSKKSDIGLELLDNLQDGRARPLILEIKYVNNISRYSKEVLIDNIIQRGWVIE